MEKEPELEIEPESEIESDSPLTGSNYDTKKAGYKFCKNHGVIIKL